MQGSKGSSRPFAEVRRSRSICPEAGIPNPARLPDQRVQVGRGGIRCPARRMVHHRPTRYASCPFCAFGRPAIVRIERVYVEVCRRHVRNLVIHPTTPSTYGICASGKGLKIELLGRIALGAIADRGLFQKAPLNSNGEKGGNGDSVEEQHVGPIGLECYRDLC